MPPMPNRLTSLAGRWASPALRPWSAHCGRILIWGAAQSLRAARRICLSPPHRRRRPPDVPPDQWAWQFVEAVLLKSGSSPLPNGSHPFCDIAGYWVEAWIEDSYEEGVTSGNRDGTYRPENSVTGAEMAVFLMNAFNLPTPDEPRDGNIKLAV